MDWAARAVEIARRTEMEQSLKGTKRARESGCANSNVKKTHVFGGGMLDGGGHAPFTNPT